MTTYPACGPEVKIVCPCCHGHRRECERTREFCEGRGWIWAILWVDR